MAIDENLIGEVRPSESAIDRLRKRNRIRPWESSLVGTQSKSKPESEGVVSPPPGQINQRVDEPEGDTDPIRREDPVGDSPRGWLTPEVKSPMGDMPSAREPKNTNPLGNLPSGSSTHTSEHLVSENEVRACKKNFESSAAAPTGSKAQRINRPGGKGRSGSTAHGIDNPEGIVPTGPDSPWATHPVGESSMVLAPLPDSTMCSTQGAIHPVGSLPTGQESPEGRTQTMTGFDPTPFLPADKSDFVWREKGSGELRIPHRLYEFAHRVTSTRNELLVFDCLLRFSLGFHRPWCEAGYSFIAAWTGINDVTNIKKSLKTLLAAGIVVKSKKHDSASNSGSIYELPVVKGYLEYAATRKVSLPDENWGKGPEGNLPSGQQTPGGTAPPAGGQETQGGVGNLPPKKENSNKTLKKTLSQSAATDLDAYVDQIKPVSKREAEIHFLGKLLSEYPSQDVSLALLYVQKFGVLGSKEQCHSPLKYLSTAIEQVLPKAREYHVLLRNIDDTSSTPKSDQSLSENESAQERLRDNALRAFETELSQDERDRLLAEVTKQNSVKGYAPPLNVLRTLAALSWFESRSCAA